MILITIKTPDSMMLTALSLYGRDLEIKNDAFRFLRVTGVIWSILLKSNLCLNHAMVSAYFYSGMFKNVILTNFTEFLVDFMIFDFLG